MTVLNLPENKSEPITLIVKYRGNFGDIPRESYLSAYDLGEGFALVTLYAENAESLIKSPAVIYAEADKLLSFQRVEPMANNAFYCTSNTDLDGDGVVIGIIDGAVDTAHPAFSDVDISYYGSANANNTHGTNVAGIIAGIAPKATIICIGINTEGDDFAKASEIMAAAARLISLANGRPLVINISYGTNDGSHSGDSLFEEYLNTIAQNELTSIVVAAGNFGNVSRHFSAVSDGEAITAEFSAVYLSFALGIWQDFSDSFSIQLTAPNNETFILPPASGRVYFHGNIGFFIGSPTPYSLNMQTFISFDNADRGIWRLTLRPQKLATRGHINIWLSQNAFTDPSAETTATLPSFADRVITAAAYDPRSDAPAPFSGKGFAANGLIKPDISAPGVGIYTTSPNGGFTTVSGTSFAAPFVSGVCALLMQWGIVRKNDLFLYGQRLKAFLRKGARRLSGVPYPDREWGYGALCLENTLELLEKEVKQ